MHNVVGGTLERKSKVEKYKKLLLSYRRVVISIVQGLVVERNRGGEKPPAFLHFFTVLVHLVCLPSSLLATSHRPEVASIVSWALH